MERAILCVDNGLTTTKSVIFTLDGREVASAVSNTVVESKGAFAEIDMELQWKKTASVIKQSIVSSGIDPSSIIGIGNSGHGAGLYCLDGADKPVRKAVSSMDARTIQILQDWSKQGKSSCERLYQNLWSGQPIPILYWLKRNEPENYKRIEKILMVKDWIIFRLTGEVGIEYTDASNSGLVDPFLKEIDQGIFEMFDIGELYEKVPRLRKSTEIAGYVTKGASEETGLREGTPVMGGVFDVVACAMAAGFVKMISSAL
jgi:L-xylulokinase